MIGAFVGAAGSMFGGAMQSKAASKAAKAAKANRRTALNLVYDDYRNNMAQRDRDQAEMNALRDRDQGVADALRDRDQAMADQLRDRDQIVFDQITDADQQRAIQYARSDEARMVAAHRDAVGYDFGRLVKEAKEAGFNPLTALAATGAANYARTPAPVIATPFLERVKVGSQLVGSNLVGSSFAARPQIDSAGAYLGGSAGVQNAAQQKVAASGYFGDVISGLGNAYTGYTVEQARAKRDADLAEAIRTGGSRSSVRGGRGGFATSRVLDARPVGNVPPSGYLGDALPSEDLAARTPVAAGGVVLPQNPWWSNATEWGNRYGEPGEWLGGLLTGVADIGYAIDRAVGVGPGEDTFDALRRHTGGLVGGLWRRAGDAWSGLKWPTARGS